MSHWFCNSLFLCLFIRFGNIQIAMVFVWIYVFIVLIFTVCCVPRGGAGVFFKQNPISIIGPTLHSVLFFFLFRLAFRVFNLTIDSIIELNFIFIFFFEKNHWTVSCDHGCDYFLMVFSFSGHKKKNESNVPCSISVRISSSILIESHLRKLL